MKKDDTDEKDNVEVENDDSIEESNEDEANDKRDLLKNIIQNKPYDTYRSDFSIYKKFTIS